MTPAEFASSAGVNPPDEAPDLSFCPDAIPGQGHKTKDPTSERRQ